MALGVRGEPPFFRGKERYLFIRGFQRFRRQNHNINNALRSYRYLKTRYSVPENTVLGHS